uniref:Uncharacterized protein n=1 Tax=Rhodosorus marinus TaxID=101924 RepID=A0A7S0G5C0_9RHOD|mmetsp:Transcript_23150/g.33226  ORF Transcript_23150/g.33226 Transcript_23150/m.33226 type:complete len:265 (+) Transcript_23150:151-945(+)
MSEAKKLRDYVEGMSLKDGTGLVKARLELAKVTGGLTDELNLQQLGLTDEDMASVVTPIANLGKNLRVLNLFFNELTFIPAEFSKLSHLEELKVGCNPLSSIPAKLFADMHRLTYLDIGYGNTLSTLPESIGECESLKELWAGNNRIRSFPSALCNCKKLEVLQVYGNDLKEIPSEIGDLKALRVLNIGRNQITHIPERLGECQNLTELQAYENDLRTIPISVANLPKIKVGNCYGNPKLGLPPREKVREGVGATLRYYSSVNV